MGSQKVLSEFMCIFSAMAAPSDRFSDEDVSIFSHTCKRYLSFFFSFKEIVLRFYVQMYKITPLV